MPPASGTELRLRPTRTSSTRSWTSAWRRPPGFAKMVEAAFDRRMALRARTTRPMEATGVETRAAGTLGRRMSVATPDTLYVH